LAKIGFTQDQQNILLANKASRETAYAFQKQFRFFEKAVSGRRAYKTPDGVTRDAIFCMRDFLREFPRFYHKQNHLMMPIEFIATIASNYSSQRDLVKYEKKEQRIKSLQTTYLALVEHCQRLTAEDEKEILEQLVERSKIINRYDILTGNGVIRIVDRLLKQRSQLSFAEFQSVLHRIAADQVTDPDFISSKYEDFYVKNKKTQDIASRAGKMVGRYRESI